jgi:hypothetical protein
MKLSIVKCPDKERFRPYVKRAALFYAENLLSKKLMDNIYVQIKFNDKLDVYGYASVEEYNDSGKPREFLIELNPGIGARDILETLAHEMVHVKQYAYSEMNESSTRWRGTKVNVDNMDYWFEPWEIEAYGMSTGLFTKFVIKEQLHKVFKNIQDPDTPIVPEPLGWVEGQQEDFVSQI